MGSPVHWGNVPEWIGAIPGVIALFRGLSRRREEQARSWGEQLEELAGLEPEELGHAIEDNPVIAEIVGLAWEQAARTGSDQKRYLLAQVAAAALLGTTTPEKVDELQFLLRTVIALDPPHITLLIAMGTNEDGRRRGEGGEMLSVPREEVEARWPGSPELLDPALGLLEQQGLIVGLIDVRVPHAWRIRPYGDKFLDFLLIDTGGWPPAGDKTDSSAPTRD